MSGAALDFISVYLRAAAPTLRDIEELGASAVAVARVDAVRKLHAIYHVQCAVGLPDPRIVEFLAGEAARIMTSSNPLAAMNEFWEFPTKAGRPNLNADRDFQIATEVRRLLLTGGGLEEVCEALATEEKNKDFRDQFGRLRSENIANIYRAQNGEAARQLRRKAALRRRRVGAFYKAVPQETLPPWARPKEADPLAPLPPKADPRRPPPVDPFDAQISMDAAVHTGAEVDRKSAKFFASVEAARREIERKITDQLRLEADKLSDS